MGHQDWVKSLKDLDRYEDPREPRELPEPREVNLSSIWRQMSDSCIKSAMEHSTSQPFLPLGKLLTILTPNIVNKLLRQEFPNTTAGKLYNQVFDEKGQPKRLKIMGTLILMERLELLGDFIKGDVEDSRLPLALDREGIRPVLYDRDGEKIKHEWPWSYPQAEYFMMKQMQLCGLFCTVEEDSPKGGFVSHFRLLDSAILPFPTCEVPETLRGGFGTVIKVKIEPSHLRYRGRTRKPEYFSVKTIQHSRQEHPYEADSLARRVAIPEVIDREHLHRLLFSFRRADFYHLVFEWADGDLIMFWQKMPGRYRLDDPGDACWFFEQCLGIMRSLNSLHNLHPSFSAMDGDELKRVIINECHGRHSDIKPQNILWFENYQDKKKDHLVIADLGLTQFNTTQSKSQVLWTNVRGYPETYKAPEGDVERRVGGKYDVWGIGCVFREHASVFLRRDFKCVKDFSKRRVKESREHRSHQSYVSDVFYNLVGDAGHGHVASTTAEKPSLRAEVKSSVQQWIKDLQDHRLCSASMSDFLALIREEMLVPDAFHRSNAQNVFTRLLEIQQSCKKNPTFACAPKNEPPEQDLESAVDDQHHHNADAAVIQSLALAGISGGQENPEASIEQPKIAAGEIDLVLASEPGPSFSAFRCMDTPPGSPFSDTSPTRSGGSSVLSWPQETSSMNELIQSVELLTINERPI